MTSNPKLSVVIPLFNKRDYIRRAVDSVLNQSHCNFELIVIDDGSTDDSLEMLFSVKDKRLRIESQENAGEGAARNRGVELATTRWVAFLDADDAWKPGFLSAISDMTKRFPSAALCATGYNIKTPASRELVGDRSKRSPQLHNNYYALAYRGKLPFCASSVAIRRDILLKSGGFPENEPLGADQDLWCRLLTHRSFALNPFPHATYHEDAAHRVCTTTLPTEELPFSRRIQKQLDCNEIPAAQQLDAKRYIAAHLLHLATMNTQHRRWSVAQALHADRRTKALPTKKYLKLAQLYGRKIRERLAAHPDHSRATSSH